MTATDRRPATRILPFACFCIALPVAAQTSPARKVTDYGAAGNGKKLETAAIQKVLDNCARPGGGKVRLPKGTFRSGTLHLRSHSGLVLEEGAVLLGSENLDGYLKPLARTPGD